MIQLQEFAGGPSRGTDRRPLIPGNAGLAAPSEGFGGVFRHPSLEFSPTGRVI